MNLFEKTGKMALGSRLRLFTARITDNASKIYEAYHIDFAPKWFPVFFVLTEGYEKSITEIATEIGHSQPSVSKIIKEMIFAGLVMEKQESADKRRNVVALTEEGKELSVKIALQCSDVDTAIENVIAEAKHNLWEALEEWENLLNEKTLFDRVQEQRRIRENTGLKIVDYEEKYHAAFKSLNEEWISAYFEIEKTDSNALDHPQSYILDKGGKIFVALYHDQPVGVCALIKMNDPEYNYEMAKMAVSPAAQGKKIAWQLAQTIINAARELGASKIYLESNTVLQPAISLYYKLGFKKIEGRATPYARCDIQMELDINN